MADNPLSALPIAGAFVAQSTPRGDSRGSFMRLFCAQDFAEANGARQIVQINWSHTVLAGTVRGLHFQQGADADAKWVRCMEWSCLRRIAAPCSSRKDARMVFRASSPTAACFICIQPFTTRRPSAALPSMILNSPLHGRAT
jgi:hypothetical protein